MLVGWLMEMSSLQAVTCTLQRASLDMTDVREWQHRRWSAVETGAWSRERRRYYLSTGRMSFCRASPPAQCQPASDKQLNTIPERDSADTQM